MAKSKGLILIVSILMMVCSCNFRMLVKKDKRIPGKYYAHYGPLVMHFEFKSDSSFYYRERAGSTRYSQGNYRLINGRKIILNSNTRVIEAPPGVLVLDNWREFKNDTLELKWGKIIYNPVKNCHDGEKFYFKYKFKRIKKFPNCPGCLS